MVQCWEPGTQYNYGDVVEYQGHCYKIIQPHRSQGDWTPDITPALWGRDDAAQQHGGRQESNQCQQPSYSAPQPQYGNDQKQSEPAYGQQQQHEEHGKVHQWVDEHKKPLEIAGGIAAGAAVLGGIGFAAKKYNDHRNENEQEAEQGKYGGQQVHHDSHPQKQNFVQEHKKELGIGAALIGGAAAIAGGVYLHKEHERKEHERDN